MTDRRGSNGGGAAGANGGGGAGVNGTGMRRWVGSFTLPRLRRATGLHSRPWGAVVTGAAVLLLLPQLNLLTSLLAGPTDTVLVLLERRLGQSIVTTAGLAVTVGLATLVIGVGCAWITSTYRFYGSRVISRLLVLPLALPAYIGSYALQGFIGQGGAVDVLLRWIGIGGAGAGAGASGGYYQFLPVSIGGFWPAVYVLTLSLYPYIYIIARYTFLRESRSLFEAASVQGVRYPLFKVALPLARPALIGGTILVAMEVINEYGTILYFGLETISTLIYHSWLNYYDLTASAQIASWVLLGLAVLYFIQRRGKTSARYSLPTGGGGPGGREGSRRLQPLSGARGAGALLCTVLPFAAGFVFPAVSLLFWSTQGSAGGGFPRGLLGALFSSIGVSGAATILCLVVGLVVSYGIRIGKSTANRALVVAATFGYALPGTVVAVAILRVFSGTPLVSGMVVLLFAYTIRYFAVSFHPLDTSLATHWQHSDYIARTFGVGALRRLLRVHIPQLRYPIISVSILIFLDILKELPLTIILRPIGLETLAVTSFYFASEEQLSAAAPAALLMLGIGLTLILLLQRVHDEREQSTFHK